MDSGIVDIFAQDIHSNLDPDWVKSIFMQPVASLDIKEEKTRLYSTADSKFTDTTIGGNICINNKSQYGRYTDPRRKGVGAGTVEPSTKTAGTNIGMGRYYSKAIDDASNILVMTFGVPEFNSPFSFYSRAISYPDSVIVNKGRSPLLYNAADAIGTAGRFFALPMFSIALAVGGMAKLFVAGATDTRYYTMKPEMVSYWSTVNNIVNYLSVERGNTMINVNSSSADKIGTVIELDGSDLEAISEISEGFITDSGYIDAFAIANRSASRLTEHMKKQIGTLEGGGTPQPDDEVGSGKTVTIKDFAGEHKSNEAYIEHEYDQTEEEPASTDDRITKEDFDKPDSKGMLLRDPKTDDRKEPGQDKGYFDSVYDYFESSIKVGGTYARFNVDYIGATTVTFDNTLKEIGAKNMFNSASSTSRDVRFNMAGGNTGIGAIDSLKEGAVDVLAGLANGVTAGLSNVLIGLLGGGMLDMPKMWDDSSVTLSSHSYKLSLSCPYNNPISLMMKLDFVLAMIIAGGSSRATGSSSYGSPYLCSAYLKGVQDTDLAMITNISITAGTGNTGHGRNGVPLGLDITFTVTELLNTAPSPTPQGLGGVFDLTLDDTKTLNRYLNSIAGRDFNTSKFLKPKILKRLAAVERDIESTLSPSRAGLWLSESTIGSIASTFIKDVTLN